MSIFVAAFISYIPFFIWLALEAVKDLYNENGQTKHTR